MLETHTTGQIADYVITTTPALHPSSVSRTDENTDESHERRRRGARQGTDGARQATQKATRRACVCVPPSLLPPRPPSTRRSALLSERESLGS